MKQNLVRTQQPNARKQNKTAKTLVDNFQIFLTKDQTSKKICATFLEVFPKFSF